MKAMAHRTLGVYDKEQEGLDFSQSSESSEELGSTKMELSKYLLLGSDHKGNQEKVNLPKIAAGRHRAIRASTGSFQLAMPPYTSKPGL